MLGQSEERFMLPFIVPDVSVTARQTTVSAQSVGGTQSGIHPLPAVTYAYVSDHHKHRNQRDIPRNRILLSLQKGIRTPEV